MQGAVQREYVTFTNACAPDIQKPSMQSKFQQTEEKFDSNKKTIGGDLLSCASINFILLQNARDWVIHKE